MHYLVFGVVLALIVQHGTTVPWPLDDEEYENGSGLDLYPDIPDKCVFPFRFEGVEYNDCAPGKYQPNPWCATSILSYGKYVTTWKVCSKGDDEVYEYGSGLDLYSDTPDNDEEYEYGSGLDLYPDTPDKDIVVDHIEKNQDVLKKNLNQLTSLIPHMSTQEQEIFLEFLDDLREMVLSEMPQQDVPSSSSECSEADGFFITPGSHQCFKFFKNVLVDWSDATSRCKKHGLVLAKPDNPIALRKYILETFGDGSGEWAWLDGRRDGSYIRWQRDGKILRTDSDMWWPEHPGGAQKGDCLALMIKEDARKMYPNQPLLMNSCHWNYHPLCELVVSD